MHTKGWWHHLNGNDALLTSALARLVNTHSSVNNPNHSIIKHPATNVVTTMAIKLNHLDTDHSAS
jgi:hypothetical protein